MKPSRNPTSLLLGAILLAPPAASAAMDRHALVTRHNLDGNELHGQIPLGNRGLLYAIAMMAAGWEGAPPGPAPGFPQDGSWTVKSEGLKRAP